MFYMLPHKFTKTQALITYAKGFKENKGKEDSQREQ
jgi:hypothetical protein